MGKTASLHNAEQGLVGTVVGRDTAFQPGMGAPAGVDHIVFGGWVGRALVKGHRHIGPECHLDRRRTFRGHVDGASIPRVAEHHPAVIDAVQIAQAEDLKTA